MALDDQEMELANELAEDLAWQETIRNIGRPPNDLFWWSMIPAIVLGLATMIGLSLVLAGWTDIELGMPSLLMAGLAAGGGHWAGTRRMEFWNKTYRANLARLQSLQTRAQLIN